jgi:predicted TPR repeat methyltransferase
VSSPNPSFLRCTRCHGEELELRDAHVICTSCGEAFEIRDGVACFQRQFDEYSENYDLICADDLSEPKTPTVVKEILADLVRERASGTVCDLGCGDGYVITRLDSPVRIGVDIAFPYLQRLPDPIIRVWSRVEDAPVRSNSVDTVVCTDVLEHVLDVSPVAAEIVRLLKPGGRVLLAFPFEQDLSVYELEEYRRKYARYAFVHLRSISDASVAEWFPSLDVRFERLITEGMPLMEFTPYPIKFVELVECA